MRQYCRKNFLSVMKMREWRDIYRQLKEQVGGLKWCLNQEPATYENLHKSLATGLLSYIGFNHEFKEYLGARGIKFYIFPGSSQFKVAPKWLITSELVETTKLYARSVARISPEWLEKIADHLVKKHYSEPYWSKKNANVMAAMRVSLYGLDIVPKRDVGYATIDPVLSREIFIRHALVYGEFQSNAEFYQYNLMLLEDVEELEHKSRKRDVLVDDETLFSYYEQLVPAEVCNGATFNRWLKTLSKKETQELFFKKEEVMQHEAEAVTDTAYPDHLTLNDLSYPLSYHFEPGAKDDGMTIEVPSVLLDQLSIEAMAWLVPGMLEEKVIALMRALPKTIRKACVPVPHYAKAAMESIKFDRSQNFYGVLIPQLMRITGIRFDESVWAETELEPHLCMNYRIIDEKKKTLAEGRDLIEIRRRLAGKIHQKMDTQVAFGKPDILSWDFGKLEASIKVKQYGLAMTMYPCLLDRGDSVELKAVSTRLEADSLSAKGILRLLMLQTPQIVKGLRNNLPENTKLSLLFAKVATKEAWQADFLAGAYQAVFKLDVGNLPQDEASFITLLEAGRGGIILTAEQMAKQLLVIMEGFQALHKKLSKKSVPLDLIELYQSVRGELESLVYSGFIQATSQQWWARIPFYLEALAFRLEKASRALNQDREYVCELEALKHKLAQKIEQKNLSPQQVDLVDIKWLMKELWISWYAQGLKTVETVSVKRLQKRIGDL